MAAPKLAVEQTTWDFGTLKEGDTETHSFKLVNRGTEPLNIDHNIIVDRPDNIGVSLEKYELGVDEGTDLVVSLDTTGLGNRRIVSFIYLKYNNKTVPFTIKGRINPAPMPLLQISPIKHDFGAVEQGDPKKATFSFANIGEGVLEVKKILFITQDKGFTIVRDISKNSIEANDEGDFEIGFRSFQIGSAEGFLLIESNSGGKGTITKVNLTGSVVPKVRGLVIEPPRPKRVEGAEPGTKPASFTVTLKNNYPFDVIVSSDDGQAITTINRAQTSQIELGLIDAETTESVKLGLEIILRKKQPPKMAEPEIKPAAPAPKSEGDTTTAAPAE
jgi:HYDIN/CFA65/VesB-like, Ig-like domain